MGIFGGSDNNKTLSDIDKKTKRHHSGKVVISNSNADLKNAIVITDDGVKIVSSNTGSGGVSCSNNGVDLQGAVQMTSKHGNVRKGEFSENSRTKKIFTYRETTLLESLPAEAAAMAAGQAGVNLSMPVPVTDSSIGMDGIMNLVTDVAAGPKPHVHTISMKHVHRIEPGYLYRIPGSIGFIKSTISALTSFFNA